MKIARVRGTAGPLVALVEDKELFTAETVGALDQQDLRAPGRDEGFTASVRV